MPRSRCPSRTTSLLRPTARARSPMMPPSPERVLQAKRIPRSENAGSLTPARRTVTETVTSRVQNAGNVSELEPAEAGTGQAVESAIAQSRETSEGAIQNRTEQDARTGRQTRPVQSSRTSSANAHDSGLIVSPKTPALPEQRNERPARPLSIASSRSEIEPRMLSSQAKDTAHSDEIPIGQSQPRPAMPMALEPAGTVGVFQDGFRNESGPEESGSARRRQPWAGSVRSPCTSPETVKFGTGV